MENWKLTWSKLIPLSDLNEQSLDSKLEGVYRLSRKDGEKVFVFYVGKGNIIERLLHHISEDEENECIQATIKSYECFFRYSIVTREDVRDAAERKMYQVYRPSCNVQEPTGRDDISVNLD